MWRIITLLMLSTVMLSCSGEGSGGSGASTATTQTTQAGGADAAATVSGPDQKLIKDRVTATIGPLPAGWSQVVFDEVGNRQVRMTLLYGNAPTNPDQVKNDTYKIAKAVLRAWAENGRDSQRDMISVVVQGQISEAGKAGANTVRSIGQTTYDYSTDQLIFKPAKG